MKITSPFFDADGQHIEYEVNGGPRGWLVSISDDLDGARPCKNLEEAIESIINHTADLARAIVAEHCIEIVQKHVSQGLVSKDVLALFMKELGQETPA